MACRRKRSVGRVVGPVLIVAWLLFAGTGPAGAAGDSTLTPVPPGSPDSLSRFFPPAEGFSAEGLDQARAYAKSIGSTAVIVIHKGRLVAEWGDTTKKTSSHSVRKSLLSALYGLAVDRGMINLNETLGQMGLDDYPPRLTDLEKTATIRHLLMARSGVYHPAAAESKRMKELRPARWSHAPGEFFYYNNWDFNVLGTIFERKTDLSIGTAFEEWIARPIGMEDFNRTDVRYATERASAYPAFPFYISARDLARFGLLFLNRGRWGNKQIIPESWVKESTTCHTCKANFGYGYMWWTYPDDDAYRAAGFGGQYILVSPSRQAVVVNRVDTGVTRQERRGWHKNGKRVSGAEFRRLLDLLEKAEQGVTQ